MKPTPHSRVEPGAAEACWGTLLPPPHGQQAPLGVRGSPAQELKLCPRSRPGRARHVWGNVSVRKSPLWSVLGGEASQAAPSALLSARRTESFCRGGHSHQALGMRPHLCYFVSTAAKWPHLTLRRGGGGIWGWALCPCPQVTGPPTQGPWFQPGAHTLPEKASWPACAQRTWHGAGAGSPPTP